MTQGDSYSVPFVLTMNGQPLVLAEITSIEFCFGGFSKSYPEVVTYDQASGKFLVPLTQQETFSFDGDKAEDVQARIKFTNGNVVATPKTKFRVYQAISTRVI